MVRNSELDLQEEKLVDQFTYGSNNTITITKRDMDSCLLQVYENGEHVGQTSFSQIARFAEMDFKLSRK